MQPGTQVIIPFLVAYVLGFIYYIVKGFRDAKVRTKDTDSN
jgi:hypothetical protein